MRMDLDYSHAVTSDAADVHGIIVRLDDTDQGCISLMGDVVGRSSAEHGREMPYSKERDHRCTPIQAESLHLLITGRRYEYTITEGRWDGSVQTFDLVR